MRVTYLLLLLLLCLPEVLYGEGPIKIGGVFSLTSWSAEGGRSELNGLRLAQEDINQAGGINGRSVELIVEDNQSDLKATASTVRKGTISSGSLEK